MNTAHKNSSFPFQRRTVLLVISSIVVLVSLLVAWATYAPWRQRTYKGTPLPAPTFQNAPTRFVQRPPAVWLLVDNIATPATYGGFCWRSWLSGGCADTVRPEEFAHLSTVALPEQTQPILIVDAPSMQEVYATVRPWSRAAMIDPATVQKLTPEEVPGGNVMVVTLPPLGDTSNQVLEVHITYAQGRSAAYVWRLNATP